MAITLTPRSKVYLGPGFLLDIYDYSAAGSGDTLAVSVTGGYIVSTEFFDANHNQIATNQPTFGTWSLTGGISSATLTANTGGVVTGGTCQIMHAGS